MKRLLLLAILPIAFSGGVHGQSDAPCTFVEIGDMTITRCDNGFSPIGEIEALQSKIRELEARLAPNGAEIHAPASSGDATIYFYRTKSAWDSFLNPTLYSGDRRLAKLEKNQFFALSVPSGTHHFSWTDSPRIGEQARVTVRPGQIAFIKVKYRTIEPVVGARAINDMRGMNPLESQNRYDSDVISVPTTEMAEVLTSEALKAEEFQRQPRGEGRGAVRGFVSDFLENFSRSMAAPPTPGAGVAAAFGADPDKLWESYLGRHQPNVERWEPIGSRYRSTLPSFESRRSLRMAPDGSYVFGTPTLAPDGTYVGGRPVLAPDGTYVGDGR